MTAKACCKCKVEKPLSEFSRHASRSDGHHNMCKVCKSKSTGKWQKDNERRKEYMKWYAIKHRYGLSKGDYETMLTQQEGLCAICRGEMKHIYVDHCHDTGRVRGLLCPRCNSAIGYLAQSDEWFQRAQEYMTFNGSVM